MQTRWYSWTYLLSNYGWFSIVQDLIQQGQAVEMIEGGEEGVLFYLSMVDVDPENGVPDFMETNEPGTDFTGSQNHAGS